MIGLSALLRDFARSETALDRPPGCVGLNAFPPKDHIAWRAADALDAAETALIDARETISRALTNLRDRP